MAVIKNNAYGHGLKEISEYLDKDERVIYLVVNNIKEALYLRNNNIKKNILILGNVESNDLPLIEISENAYLVKGHKITKIK